MSTLDIHDPAATLAGVVERAHRGEEITISEHGKPLAKIIAVSNDVNAYKSGELMSSPPVPEWKAALMQAAGMWKDRDDIPELMAQIRREWNRIEPPDDVK